MFSNFFFKNFVGAVAPLGPSMAPPCDTHTIKKKKKKEKKEEKEKDINERCLV